MTVPVIDIEQTSVHLKNLRESRNLKISDLQKIFNMENPQSIYNWENPNLKNLPRIDNLVILAKFYNLKIDDLIVVKDEETDCLELSSCEMFFGIDQQYILYIKKNSSIKTIDALTRFYNAAI